MEIAGDFLGKYRFSLDIPKRDIYGRGMEELLRLWSANIKRGRKALGLSQESLAELLDVRQGTVARWEAGKRTPSDRHKLAISQALRQDVRQLFPLTRGAA